MSEFAKRQMTPDAFHRWLFTPQDHKLELSDGQPIMMAGANRRPDCIVSNVRRQVGNHLEGHRCQPLPFDTSIRIPAGNRRQADMGIEYGRTDDTALEADSAALVFEVLWPTTRTFDRNDELEEYKTVETIEYILLVDPDFPQMRLYSRDTNRPWTGRQISGMDAIIELPHFDMAVSLAELYARLEFRPRPASVTYEFETDTSKFSI